MYKKNIKCNEIVLNLSFDEVFNKFDNFLKKEAKESFKIFKYDTYEDAFSDFSLWTWEAYNDYDYYNNPIEFSEFLKTVIREKALINSNEKDNEYKPEMLSLDDESITFILTKKEVNPKESIFKNVYTLLSTEINNLK